MQSIEEEKRKHRCSFTGHRPEKQNMNVNELSARTVAAVSNAINDGLTTFITGMAPGFDIIAAEAVLKLKEQYPNLKLICAIPYPGFEKRKDLIWCNRIENVFNSADLVKYICQSYSKACFMQRNKWMVDHSALVITDYNGTAGGTRNTINYAKKQNIPIKHILFL